MRLILKGTDFSDMSVKKLDPIIVINAAEICSAGDNSIRYRNYNNISQFNSFGKDIAQNKECVLIFDVRDYVGKTLSMKACELYLTDFYANCFASDADIEEIKAYAQRATGLGPSEQGGALENKVTDIDNFMISISNYAPNTIERVVPANAKYLIITNASAILGNEDVVVYAIMTE
jgi:hypothetical protein